VTVLLAAFFIGALFLRGSGEEASGPTTSPPVAGETTTSTGSETGTTEVTGTTPGDTTATTVPLDPNLPALQGLEFETQFEGFRQPSTINAIEGDDRLFISQRLGVIRILDVDRDMLDPAFLDISDSVLAGGIEQGLLGFDFHPDFANNGLFYVYYTDKGGRRQLSEFEVSVSDPNRARAESERVLWEQEQPPDATDIRHYGGQVAFGPDGYLWFSSGDGADSRAQGQDPQTMFGAVMRIDVDSGEPYGIPADNPFVGTDDGADEVWAYGLRNPWRFSIDEQSGMIYIADVGHADQEEVNVQPASVGGYNFGWSDVEGTRCFHAQPCDLDLYTSPAITYLHEEGCSVTGGYVYRGSEIPELDGTYFYSDWCSQWIRSFKFVDGQVTEETDLTDDLGTIGQINSFGIGGDGELYVVTHDGTVAKVIPTR
jgi:hypothetical protein